MQKVGVVFVCLGNICRSPLAEGVFRHLVEEKGWSDRLEIDSAGTSGYHDGDPPDPRSAETAQRRGITLTGQSRKLEPHDLERFDYVVVMDAENEAEVRRVERRASARAEVMRLRRFDSEANGDLDVPDPYYGGPRGFENVHDMVERSCRALLDHIAREHAWLD